jgi:hypothetical protein
MQKRSRVQIDILKIHTTTTATNTENKWSRWIHSSKVQVICCIFVNLKQVPCLAFQATGISSEIKGAIVNPFIKPNHTSWLLNSSTC